MLTGYLVKLNKLSAQTFARLNVYEQLGKQQLKLVE